MGGEAEWQAKRLRWFRPASALWTQHILSCVRKKGYTTAITSCYPHDVIELSRHVNSHYLKARVRPGAIIVVHDRWHTPATLARALPVILKSGMELGTLSDVYAAQAAELQDSKQE